MRYISISKESTWSRTLTVTALVAIFSVVVLGLSFISADQASAARGSGGGGSGPGGSWNTANGHGWKRFSKTSGGPSNGFYNGTRWSDVLSICSQYNSNYVWVHIVRHPNGSNEMGFNYWSASYNKNRPADGSGPYLFDGGGWEYPPRTYGHGAIPFVTQVYNQYRVEHTSWADEVAWSSDDVGWFCDGRKIPPWNISPVSRVKNVGTPSNPSTLGTDSGWSASTTAIPGETLNYKHTLTVTGANMPSNMAIAVVRGTPSSATAATVGDRSFYNNPAFYPNPPLFASDYTALTYVTNIRGNNGSVIANFGNYSGSLNGSPQQRAKTIYTVKQGDVGHDLCQRIDYGAPASHTNSGYARSNAACATVPYSYTLVPQAPTVPSVVEVGQTTDSIQSTVNHTGPTKSRGTDIRYVRVINPGSTAAPGSRAVTLTAANACSAYGSTVGALSCGIVSPVAGGNNRVFNHPSNDSGGRITTTLSQDVDPAQPYVVHGDLNPGDRVCWGLAISGHNTATGASKNGTRFSALNCSIVGKKPKVQIHGGNLMVGRGVPGSAAYLPYQSSAGIDTSTTTIGPRTYGSWTEYGVFAPARIRGMASASGFSGAAGGASSDQVDWSNFTFNRVTPAGSTNSPYGYFTNYTLPRTMPDVAAAFRPTASTPTITSPATPRGLAGSNSPRAGRVVTVPTGTTALTIDGNASSQLLRGQWAVLYAPNTDITITQNITNEDGSGAPFGSVEDIPQLVIIAQNITIHNTVTNVDAWLIATNAISTCQQQASGTGTARWLSTGNNYASTASGADARLRVNLCNTQLTVNGPVMTGKLYLRRTAGADSAASAHLPAEVFNLRPDAYLWLNYRLNGTQTAPVYQTTSMKEVPPRY